MPYLVYFDCSTLLSDDKKLKPLKSLDSFDKNSDFTVSELQQLHFYFQKGLSDCNIKKWKYT